MAKIKRFDGANRSEQRNVSIGNDKWDDFKKIIWLALKPQLKFDFVKAKNPTDYKLLCVLHGGRTRRANVSVLCVNVCFFCFLWKCNSVAKNKNNLRSQLHKNRSTKCWSNESRQKRKKVFNSKKRDRTTQNVHLNVWKICLTTKFTS